MTIKEKEDALVDDFAFMDDWEQKYEYLIDLGKELKGFPEDKRTEDYLIRGCQSQVWLAPEFKDGKVLFKADSDGILPKGIIAMLVHIFSGHRPEEITQANFDFIQEIGLQEFLSPTRANGLLAMTKQIRLYALAYQMKQE